jgi:hypothetical protein
MSWRIVNQHQTSVLTPASTFEDVMEITAVSNSTGTPVTIRVPMVQYTAERVKAELDSQFATVHEVHALTGD